ncbi:MAG: sigma-70 family RNA polymerase sigma factor [Polyangiaceae bacterium]|nr:sigma-70 family RNA polymerase sigma factor [Myxococcales bacterium]MCB9589380.1 sigma-70 family RNA polymerase sigma factor [Polyangiaceae bacterium]
MKNQRPSELGSAVEALKREFLQDVERLRPRLHRYCTGMTGSALDGEDIVQETLAHAFFRLSTLQDPGALKGWLFRIAHNKCIDFIRARQRQPEHTEAAEGSYETPDQLEAQRATGEALEALLSLLPPKERAALLLKDVFDYSLLETAEIIDSSLAGVKAALHRGRSRLKAESSAGGVQRSEAAPRSFPNRALLDAYVESFNAKDWGRLQTLIREDARLELVGFAELPLGSSYQTNYAALPWEWRLGLGYVHGEPVVIHYRKYADGWRPHSAIRVQVRDGQLAVVRDYVHIDYLLESSDVDPPAPGVGHSHSA